MVAVRAVLEVECLLPCLLILDFRSDIIYFFIFFHETDSIGIKYMCVIYTFTASNQRHSFITKNLAESLFSCLDSWTLQDRIVDLECC